MIEEGHVIVHRFGNVIFPRTRILDAAVDDDNIPIIRDFPQDVIPLGYDEVFPIVQGRHHRFTRNAGRLEEEDMDDHGNGQRDDNGINPFVNFM